MVQCGANLTKYPPETAKILHRYIFWFFLHDEEFVSKTINDGNVNLDRFLASKVRQLAKRMESSKATAHHIKQVAGDPQTANQPTQAPAHRAASRKIQEKEVLCQVKTINHKNQGNEKPLVSSQHKKWFDVKNAHQNKEQCSKCGDLTHVEGFQCPAKKFQCKACHKFGHFTSLCYQKKQASSKSRKPKVHQLHAGAVYAKESARCGQS